jgi:CheY-like chemotaxis protein
MPDESTSGRILVVDDDPIHRELVVSAVIEAGFEAHTAHDGEEGWEALCRQKYDLVITDHQMPKLTGLKLIERLRAVSANPPCILISGWLPEPAGVLIETVQPGAVFAKPFPVAHLVETIFRLLGHPSSVPV